MCIIFRKALTSSIIRTLCHTLKSNKLNEIIVKKFIFFCICLIFPFSAYALDRLEIDNFLIDATIKDDGSMHVKELFYVKGDFSSFERRLTYKTSSYESHEQALLLKDTIYNVLKEIYKK